MEGRNGEAGRSIGSPSKSESRASSGSSGMNRSSRFVIVLSIFAVFYYFVTAKEEASIVAGGIPETSAKVPKEIPTPRLDDNATKQFILNPDQEFTPAIVWLMSFPNSGTSYTMTMVARSSNKAFATNYCDEVMDETDEESLSIYPRRPEGPFWAGKSGKLATPRDLPSKYVITKTHCGSRCLNCGPADYVETPAFFLKRCASGHARVPPKRRRMDVQYPPERVAKAIHLIRNPFHNIIARYHLEHRHKGYKDKQEWLDDHPNDMAGLQKYCADLDEQYREEDETYFGKDKVPLAPCHGEFFKWTQWHNLAIEGVKLIEKDHEVPTLTIYYENYSKNFNQTVDQILDFLELSQDGVLREFSARSDYDGYFSDEQVRNVRKLVKRVASDKTWSLVKHYFEE